METEIKMLSDIHKNASCFRCVPMRNAARFRLHDERWF